jgi:hypothetical protein
MSTYWGIFYFTKMAKEIILTQGKVAIVDDDMFDYLNQWKWYAHEDGNTFYARRNITISNSKQSKIQMHRLIAKPTKDMVIDHIDGDGLNNQRINLRICTSMQNIINRKLNANSKTGYKGVSYIKISNKFRAYININRINKHLGYFIDPIDAARAYNAAALKYHGEFANLNKID